jgi:hypothetical protein
VHSILMIFMIQTAGSQDVVELHGSLWLLKKWGVDGFIEEPGVVWEDRTQPLVPALKDRGLLFLC